ncbi:MAG: hypothetical protein QOC92_3530 [Acidimicrobiaceae bacterium]
MNRLRAALAGVDDRLLALRDQLTPGQRWSAALALGVALSVLLWGLPIAHNTVPGIFGDTAAAATAPAVGGGALATPSNSRTAAAALPAASPYAPLAANDIAASVRPPLPPNVPTVVALVRTGDGLPNRDDNAIASAFLDRAGFPATKVIDDGTPTMCDRVAAAGRVVVMGTGLDAARRQCLVDRGLVVVAFDELGDQPPAAAGGGEVVSTRRGAVASLLDLGRWGSGGALKGRVGIVVDESVRPLLGAVEQEWAARGIEVAGVSGVPAGAGEPAAIADGVRKFATAGVEVVVFALPVDAQRQWLAQEAVLLPAVRHVVSDLFNGVIDEAYLPSFDGATAHTSLREPWWSREKGETPEQSVCRQTWEAAGRTTLSAERVQVFAWCQHVALVATALIASETGTPFAQAMRRAAMISPLTSDLGALPDGGYGPAADVALTWRTSCTCWASTGGFEARPA